MGFQFLSFTSPLISILILFSIAIYLYLIRFYGLKHKGLYAIRLSILSFLIFLLFNPIISYDTEKIKNLKWAVFLDNSASIKYHKSPSLASVNIGISQIFSRMKKEDIKYQVHSFDSKIEISDGILNGEGQTTNLGNLAEYISEQDFAGGIIFTDGISNEGLNPRLSFKNSKIPIYSIGIGNQNSLVDIFLNSINTPTVAIKNERINVAIDIQSIGDINDRFSVSLYENKKLIASKYVRLYGMGSKVTANFQFEPKALGKQQYTAQVSSLADEVNINNNKQNFNILILKDKYRVGLITGSPNKNTSIIKKSLSKNKRIVVDHYVKISESDFSKNIKSFWQTSYDLIIFDNYPINPFPTNFIRVLAKKGIAQQSALMLIAGPNQTNESISGLEKLLGLGSVEKFEEFEDDQFWDFEDQSYFFKDLPPMKQALYLGGLEDKSKTIATFESGWPLLIRGNNKFRSVTIASSNINKLYYNKGTVDSFSKLFSESIEWLIKSGVTTENFFQMNRDYYQQGEIAYLSGSDITKKNDSTNFYLKVTKNDEVALSKEIDYNIDSKKWEVNFRAPKAGIYQFEIYSNTSTKPIQTDEFTVLESQVELNQVYLNEALLKEISIASKGSYMKWEDRDKIFEYLKKKEKREVKANVIKFKENIFILVLIVILLCSEWFSRKQKGFF